MDLVWELMMEIDWRDKGLVMELIFSGRLITLRHYLRTSVQRKWMDEGRRRSGLFYTCEKLS